MKYRRRVTVRRQYVDKQVDSARVSSCGAVASDNGKGIRTIEYLSWSRSMNALCILVICFLPLSPDEGVLKNGRTIDGKIIVEDEKRLVVEMKYGKVEVSRSQVDKIIRSKRGKVFSGKAKEAGRRAEAPVTAKGRDPARPAPVRPKPPKIAPNGPAARILAEFEREVAGKKKMDNDMVNAFRKRLVPLGNPCIPDLAYEIHHSSNWMVRHLAVSALRQLKDPDAIPALIDALNDRTLMGHSFGGYADDRMTKYYIRQNAALALKEIGKEAVFAIKKIAEDRRHPDYENAVYALSKADGPIVEDILQKIARDTSQISSVRLDAAWGIAGRSDESNRICINMLKDRKLCEDVARALKKSRDQSMIDHLLVLVSNVEQNYDAAATAAELVNSIALRGWHPADLEEHVDYFMLANQGSRRSIDRKIGI